MVKDKDGWWVESPVKEWFGLSYSSYLVVPRMAMEAMPLDWQERLVALMEEAHDIGLETPSYHVLRNDPAYTLVVKEDPEDETSRDYEFTAISEDPWENYRRPDKGLLPDALKQSQWGGREP